MDIACLGLVGFTVLSVPTGTSLYSGFFVIAQIKHARHVLDTAWFA
jgi:hypothetical protein